MNLEKYTFSTGKLYDNPVIFIQFPYDKNLILDLKQQFPYAKWSNSKKSWYIYDSQKNRRKVFPNLPLSSVPILSPQNQTELNRFLQQLQLKAYSPNTIKTYTTEFKHLLTSLNNHPVNLLSAEKLKSYFLYCVNELKLDENHLNSRLNAVKFYFEKVLHQSRFFLDIPRPKKPRLMPKILSIPEVQRLFLHVANPKHNLMLKLCYGMGLRVSEIVNLQVSDIDSHRMQVLIRQAKGKKDRYVKLPDSILNDLRFYYSKYKPSHFLFEGQYNQQYSIRSVQAVFKKALKNAGIKKQTGIHGLRHSYATHLLESGVDISFIQHLLGHNSIKTTQLYLHVSRQQLANIHSPLDLI